MTFKKVGYTNKYQLQYVDEGEEAAFYPDTDDQCNIPLYIDDGDSEERAFSMSMYITKEELYKDKAKYYQYLYEKQKIKIAELDKIAASDLHTIMELKSRLTKIHHSSMKPMSEFPKIEGTYLVYMPDDKHKPYQVMYYHDNITIIGNCFEFDAKEPTHFIEIVETL